MKHVMLPSVLLALSSPLWARGSGGPAGTGGEGAGSAYGGVSGSYGFFGNGHSAAGMVMKLGFRLDENQSIELEAGTFSDNSAGGGVRYLPVTAGYRYEIPVSDSGLAYLGASAGSFRESPSGFNTRGSAGTTYAAGLKAGVSVEVARGLTAELSGHLMQKGATDLSSSGLVGYVSLGLGYRF